MLSDELADCPATGTLTLGDPVKWFTAVTITGTPFDLSVAAGRWIVLCFLGSPANPRAIQELDALLQERHLFDEDRLVLHGVFTEPPADSAIFAALSGPALSFFADYDGAISRAFGGSGRTVVLDPMLRAVANIGWDHPAGHGPSVRAFLSNLPSVSETDGVPMTAPVLMVPRVFDYELCDYMINLYENIGGEDSGFMLDVAGKTATVVDHRLKRRRDLVIALPELREAIRSQIVRRLVPPVARFFQFHATRMDRYIVACYDSETGGHFHRHRDNVNAGAAHRRFAVSINLNRNFEGCDLVFPEFGRKLYRVPMAGAVVFSCGALHQVTPVTRGRRYAFLAFLYCEEDAARREANNTRLHANETRYSGLHDRLYPDQAA
jgi:predicted 2-oxoglutarate/Fe(II)-dependent dioxygenase YbiX/peroxiredoxin